MYPGSMKVGAQLGNLRFCNMRLGPHHQWGWFCDLRDPGSASLVKVGQRKTYVRVYTGGRRGRRELGYLSSFFGKVGGKVGREN